MAGANGYLLTVGLLRLLVTSVAQDHFAMLPLLKRIMSDYAKISYWPCSKRGHCDAQMFVDAGCCGGH